MVKKKDIKTYYDESDIGFLTKIKLLFLHPKRFFENVKDENIKYAFAAFIIFFIILANIGVILRGNIVGLIFYFLFTLAILIWVHIFVRVFGGNRGIVQTLKVSMYSFVPMSMVIILNLIVINIGLLFSPYYRIYLVDPLPAVIIHNDVFYFIFNQEMLFVPDLLLDVIMYFLVWAWTVYLISIGFSKVQKLETRRAFIVPVIALAALSLIDFVTAPLLSAILSSLFG